MGKITLILTFLLMAVAIKAQTAADSVQMQKTIKGCRKALAKWRDITGVVCQVYLYPDEKGAFYVLWDADRKQWLYIDLAGDKI